MKKGQWRKWTVVIFVICLLVGAFWYGGGSSSLHGFRIAEESYSTSELQDRSQKDVVAGDEASAQMSDDKGAGGEVSQNSKSAKGNLFQQIVMHIKQVGSSKHYTKNTQNNKVAQKNANKAYDKEQKKQSNTKKKKQQQKQMVAQQDNQKHTTDGQNQQDDSAASDKSENTNGDKSNQPEPDDRTSNSEVSKDDGKTPSKDNTQTSTTEVPTTEAKKDTVQCTISIACNTLLDNLDALPKNKHKLVPQDGMLLKETTVTVEKGKTVFDVLQKATKDASIPLEYSFTPAFKSYYIEGIGNLYEFDGGQLSGWMYNVNGEFPNYGCSSYTVHDKDVIKWVYTCNLGKDVGCYFME